MEQLKSEFLAKLNEGLKKHPERESILAEYETHLDELLLELWSSEDEGHIREALYARLGSPDEIVSMWAEELSVTPSRMKWLFVAVNGLFFAGGVVLTTAHHLVDSWLVSSIWNQLTSIPILIALVYMLFWALLGYEIGKGFGHKGKRLLRGTFWLALTPNLVLMGLTLFGVIPRKWFAPLLTESFIALCIGLTILLYPLCLMAYQWGKKASV